jgi:hypothetical protein
MKDNYLYIFVHAYKTGGTTLAKHLLKNFRKDEILNLTYKELGIYPDQGESADWQKKVFAYLDEIPQAKRKKIKVVLGHILPYGIHRFFPRKPHYLTMVRNPGKRVLSFYNYYRQLYENERKMRSPKKLYRYLLLIKDRLPLYSNWLREKYLRPDNFVYLSQPGYFRTLGYFHNRPKLDKFFFVGITEKSEEDLLYLYYLLGINKFFLDQNISKKFVSRESFKNHEEEDFYRLALRVNRKFKQQHSNFAAVTQKMKIKRALLLPFTQVVFDFSETCHLLSAKIRERSKLYSNLWDFLKARLVAPSGWEP